MISSTEIHDSKILIVDDQEANIRLLDRILRDDGYSSIRSTMNPHEVCDLYRKRHYDLILLDLEMPGMDGFQVIEGLNAIDIDSYTPVLVITAHPGHKLRALQAGAKDFISKPIEIAEVVARVRNILEVRLLHQKLRRHNEMLEQRVRERSDELINKNKQLMQETEGRILVLEELRKNELLLIHQSRMAALGEMLGYIAHQWRQPLNVLGLKVQEIGLSYELGGFSKELLDTNIDKAMKILRQLSQTIDVFRDFSAPDKEKKLFMVDSVARNTISLIQENFTELGIAIQVITSGVPQINGYPNEYGQVLLNILMNAKDAFDEQHVADGLIKVHISAEDGRTVLTVTDNAGGIDAKIIDKIFDPYFTTKELGKGTGIGLFMSKGIIEKNMGGCFTARNVEGGAEFRIEV